MTETEILDLARESMIVTIKLCGPVMLIGLVVGVVISMFQTVTQIQEATVAFVPKILIVFAAILVLMPFMLTTMRTFMTGIAEKIVQLGGGG